MTKSRKKASVGRRPRAKGSDMNTRADILSAARKVFALKGFSGTSMREVAESARVNKAMIYYYFQDKVELYRAVLSDSFNALKDIWKHDVFQGNASARTKIRKYIDGYIRFQHNNDELRKILAMEFSTEGIKGDHMKWVAKNFFAENHASLVAILEAGMRSGELKKIDPFMAAIALIGMIVHVFVYMPIAPYLQKKRVDISSVKLGAFVNELFFRGVSAPKVNRKRIENPGGRS